MGPRILHEAEFTAKIIAITEAETEAAGKVEAEAEGDKTHALMLCLNMFHSSNTCNDLGAALTAAGRPIVTLDGMGPRRSDHL